MSLIVKLRAKFPRKLSGLVTTTSYTPGGTLDGTVARKTLALSLITSVSDAVKLDCCAVHEIDTLYGDPAIDPKPALFRRYGGEIRYTIGSKPLIRNFPIAVGGFKRSELSD